MIMLILAFFFQLTQVPDGVPTYELPEPVQTLEARGQEYSDELDNIEALGEDIEIDGDGISVYGQDLSPEMDNQLFIILLGYTKWLMTAGADSVFGPFSGLMPHIFAFILLAFIEPIAMGLKRAFATVAAILSWIAENFVAFLVIAVIIAIVVAFLAFTGWFAEQWSRFASWF